jgi:hypothetical protein
MGTATALALNGPADCFRAALVQHIHVPYSRRRQDMPGVRTARLALDLGRLIQTEPSFAGLQVYCGHRGEISAAEFQRAGVQIKGLGLFIGSGHCRVNRIAMVDIAVVTVADPMEAVIVFEGEESRNGVSPKLIFADAVSPLLADRMEIEGRLPKPIRLDRTTGVVAFHQRRGDDRARTALLEQLLQKAAGALRPGQASRTVQLCVGPAEHLWPHLLAHFRNILEEWPGPLHCLAAALGCTKMEP